MHNYVLCVSVNYAHLTLLLSVFFSVEGSSESRRIPEQLRMGQVGHKKTVLQCNVVVHGCYCNEIHAHHY